VLSFVTVTAAAFASATGARAAAEREARPSGTRAQRVLTEVNEVRVQHALVPLRLSADLTAAATEHSWEMARAGYFGHDALGGLSVAARLARYYSSAGHDFWSIGENLAWGSPNLGAARTLREWLRSPPHRENLFAQEWREIGIGAVHVGSAPGIYRGAPVTIVTVDFGVRR
jgi:uncharacterized protein YkwD